MRKLEILTLAAAMMLCACGHKTDSTAKDADSTVINQQTDSLAAQADGVEAAPDGLWTEDAVKADIRKMYERLNEMTDVVRLGAMDSEFCTSHYLSVKQAISDYDEQHAQADIRFYGDEEGFRWTTGLSLPLIIKEVKAELLTGDMARAFVRFDNPNADDEEFTGSMFLDLWFENGHWRVNNFDDPQAFGTGGLLGMMEKYAREHNIETDIKQ